MLGFNPIASSIVYPVNFSNVGFTYSIDPLASVIVIETGLCSIAIDNFLTSRSAFKRSVISLAIPRTTVLPLILTG